MIGQVFEDFETDRLVHLGQRGVVEIIAHQHDEREALVGQKRFEQVTDLGLVKRADFLAEGDCIAVGYGCADMSEERRCNHTVCVIDAHGFRAFGVSVFVQSFRFAQMDLPGWDLKLCERAQPSSGNTDACATRQPG